MLARLLLIALLVAPTAIAGAVGLRLREEAFPAGSIVRLGEVADIDGIGPAERDRLAALPLMPAPAPGVVQHLSATVLRELLAAQGVRVDPRQLHGADATAISTRAMATESLRGRSIDELARGWRSAGPAVSTTTAAPATQRPVDRGAGFRMKRSAPTEQRPVARRAVRHSELRVVEERVRNTIGNAISTQASETPWAIRGLRFSETAVRELYELRRQDWSARLDNADRLGPGEVRFLVWPGSRGARDAFRVIAELVEQEFHVVAAQPMARGALVTRSGLKLEPTPLDKPLRGSAPYASIDEVVGKETTRAIRPGQPLSTDNVANPLMVHRGETVTIISGGGGVSVRLTAIAKGDGRVGDLVTVEAYDRKERFDARVVGRRRLAILSAGGGEARLATLHTGGLR